MKLYRNIIIVVVVIALLVVGIVILNNSDKEEPQANTPSGETTPSTDKKEVVNVLQLDFDSITKIHIKTSEEDYTISKDSSGNFVLSDSENLKINDFVLQSVAAAYSNVTASQLVSDKAEDADVYGFNNPQGSVTISLADGTEKIIYIGNSYIGSEGNYIKLADENKIYGMDKYGISSLVPVYNAFIDTDVMSINSSTYETLSYIEINKSGNTPYKLEYVTDTSGESPKSTWKMIKPTNAEANTIVLTESILTPLENFNASSVMDAKPEDLSVYGLDTPYAKFTVAAEGVSQTFVLGKEAEGYRFMMVDDYASVYMVPTSSVSFVDVPYIDLMSRLVHLEDIKDISKVEIKAPNVDFIMEINADKRAINGTEVKKDAFAKAYQAVIGMLFDNVDDSAKSGTAEATIKYTRNDGSVCIVSFVPVDDLNYLALVDGKGNAIVSKSTFNEAIGVVRQKLNEAK